MFIIRKPNFLRNAQLIQKLSALKKLNFSATTNSGIENTHLLLLKFLLAFVRESEAHE